MGFVADAPTTGRFVADGATSDAPMFPRVQSQTEVAPTGLTASTPEFARSSFGKGVADLVSFPFLGVDLINKALKIIGLPMPDRPALGSQDVRELVQKGFMTKDYQPTDLLQKMVGGAARFIGSSAIPSAGTIGRAAMPLSALSTEAFAAAEGGAASAIGSDIGGDIGKHIGGDTGQKVGEMAGGVLGGVTGTITGGTTPYLISKGRALVGNNINKETLSKAGNSLAAKEISGALNANPSSAENLTQAASAQESLAKLGAPGFAPTLAQASGAPAIASLEGNVARSTPQELGKYSQNFSQNEGVINTAVNNAFPEGGNIARSADSTLRNTNSMLDSLQSRINQAQQDVASSLPGAAQQFAGEKLQILRDQAQKVARSEKTFKINQLYETADKAGVKSDMTDVVDAVQNLKNADPQTFQNMPPVFSKVINQYGDKTKELTGRSIDPQFMALMGVGKKPEASFEELHSLYRETNSQLATAQRVGDQNATYYLGHLKNVLKGKVDSIEGAGGEVGAKLKDFNQWFSTKYAPAFYEGVGGRMAASNRFGDVVKPESVVGKFFTPSGIDDFNLVYQGNNEAQQALKDGVVGLFKDAAVKDGRIDPAAAQRFIRSNQETLAKVPDIASTLKSGTALNDALTARGARLTEAQTALDKTTLAKIAGEPDNAKVIQNALADPVYLRQLIATARDPRTAKAVSRGIVDGIPQAAEKAGTNPLAFVLSNEATLKPAMDKLSPQHFDNLLTIATAQTIQGRVRPPAHGEALSIGGVTENFTGSSPRTIWSQMANTVNGRQSSGSAILFLLSRFGIKTAEDRAGELMKSVIYNPALAAEMAKASKLPFSVGESNKLSEHLMNAGIRIGISAQQGQSQ